MAWDEDALLHEDWYWFALSLPKYQLIGAKAGPRSVMLNEVANKQPLRQLHQGSQQHAPSSSVLRRISSIQSDPAGESQFDPNGHGQVLLQASS